MTKQMLILKFVVASKMCNSYGGSELKTNIIGRFLRRNASTWQPSQMEDVVKRSILTPTVISRCLTTNKYFSSLKVLLVIS